MLTPSFGEITAFALDLDGTLANTTPMHSAARLMAFNRMADETRDRRFAFIPNQLHADAHLHGSSAQAIIGWVLQEAGIVTDLSDKRVQRTVEHKKEIYAKLSELGQDEVPGAINFLQKLLVAEPDNVAIVTAAHKDTEVEPFLKRYSLKDNFPADRLVCYEDVGPDYLKPHPKAYEIIMSRFGLRETPEKLLVLEDTRGGIVAANAVGATVVAIATTHTQAELFKFEGAQKPAYVISDFDELSSMIGLDS